MPTNPKMKYEVMDKSEKLPIATIYSDGLEFIWVTARQAKRYKTNGIQLRRILPHEKTYEAPKENIQ